MRDSQTNTRRPESQPYSNRSQDMSRKSWGKCRTRTMAALAAAFVGFLGFMSASALPAAAQIPVTTYHYDNNRTGWNQTETALTPANVGSATFGLLQKITLDDQVDAQPLVVPGVLITAGKNQGVHDVVYVATENNSVYAIDVHSGTVLLNPNFGTPVSYPLGCNNNGPNVGITATPVIDSSSNTLYVMIYTQDSSGPAYRLHALDLGSLADKVTPQLVTASHTLTNGTTFNFNATYQRQRSGLLLANGSVYAGFASFCDSGANLSRGWLLGWTAGTLAPFPSNRLNDQQASSPNTFFLSSIWMSGYAPAIDDEGNVLFVTGNSDPSGTTYDGVTNIQESVVKVSPTLTTMVDLFTPQDWADLDEADNDFGAGGVLVLPDQPGATPHLAVAAGKDGNMYLMNEDHLGGYSPTTNNVLGTYSIGGCWCGPSYFVDPSDGAGRVVSSGGGSLEIWKVQTSPSVSLTNVGNVSGLGTSAQDGGFFTSISSNGTANPIIWAISRPLSANNGSPISLYAFNAESGGGTPTKLFQATAGSWPNMTGNANLIPVVANGLVFVASNQQVQIFGLLGGTATTTALTSSVNPSVSGKPVLFTATVSSQSGGGVPMGKVQFMSGTAVLATATLSSGTARYTDSKLQTGNNNITAVYEGSSTYSGSTSSPVDQFVLIATTTTLTSSPSSSSYGQVVNFTAAVTSGSGTPPNGETVTFRQGTTMLGTGTLSGGSATFSTAALGVGTRAVTAVYGGDTTFAASTSKLVNQTIVKSTTSAALTSSQSPSVFAQSVSFTATVTPQFGSPPTGTVTFRNGTATLGTAPLTDGVASFTTTRLPVGSASITASYNGSPDFTPSTSTALSQIVNQASTTTALTSQLNPSTYRQAVTFTATLTAPYGGTITGTVTFMDGSTTLKTLVVGGGEAKYTTSMLATGVHNITAIYSGSSNFIGSSNSISQTVN
jgi:hypothetical protein